MAADDIGARRRGVAGERRRESKPPVPSQGEKSALRLICARFLRRFFSEHGETHRTEVLAAAAADEIKAGESMWRRAREDAGITSRGRAVKTTWFPEKAAPDLDAKNQVLLHV